MAYCSALFQREQIISYMMIPS
ncbi:MAG: hypothetical protein METHAR1v1_420006 [Methanothrix sp.]|nr:MAG: hypothetical protein METHAR1v1_420006 [Methanothrix sp.]